MGSGSIARAANASEGNLVQGADLLQIHRCLVTYQEEKPLFAVRKLPMLDPLTRRTAVLLTHVLVAGSAPSIFTDGDFPSLS